MPKLKRRLKKSVKKLTSSKLMLFIVAFAVIASIAIIATKAATPTANIEPESGTIISPAVVGTDSTASNGKYVKFVKQTTGTLPVSSTNPCIGSAAPAKWKHVIFLLFENHTWDQVIGNSDAPYITGLVGKCGSSYSGTKGSTPKNNWHDANYKVDGTSDGGYNSKPSYAVLTDGVPGTVSGIIDDKTPPRSSSVDNIFRQLLNRGITVKDYFAHSGTGCSSTGSGDYHDPIRYYNDITTAECDAHDVNISTFSTDLNSGNLPAYSFILPTNDQNMHNSCSPSSVACGDVWAQNFLNPILDSAQYKTGDTAIFFLWDEETAIPNILLAPSVKKGSKVPAPSGNPISHYAALRTTEEMLGLPYIGDTGQAPSLLSFFNGQ